MVEEICCVCWEPTGYEAYAEVELKERGIDYLIACESCLLED